MIPRILVIASVLLVNFAFPLHAEPSNAQLEIIKATLVSETDSIPAGKNLIRLGVLLEPKEGWHTYWENPGDAGMATSLTWTLPEGFSASGIDWPAPKRLMEGPLATHSYMGTVFLPVTITLPTDLKAGSTYSFSVQATWLVCKDICIPESATLVLDLPVKEGTPAPSLTAGLFEAHDKQRIATLATPGSYSISERSLSLFLPDSIPAKNVRSAIFFPRQENIIHYANEQKLSLEKDHLVLTLDRTDEAPKDIISGIITLTLDDNSEQHFDIKMTKAAPAAGNASGNPTLSLVLLFAVLGGLILNLMPCVLPVLSLKALAVVQKAGSQSRAVIAQGVAYTLGILVSFAVIAGILIGLQQTGEVVGWGYQMQSPAFVGFLIYLLFIVGLNLSGLFHLPVLLGGVGNKIADEVSPRGSFFTGVLATAVATPCTGPFMASAVGVALTLPPLQALLVFEALGLGLALPFLLISLFPPLRRFLPKPGAWMETFKELLAFPMYASVIWLLWVLTLQTGAGGMVVALTGLLLIVICMWMRPLFAHGHSYRPIAVLSYALIAIISLSMLSHMEITTSDLPSGHSTQDMEEMGVNTVAFSPSALAELRNAGKPVFVDATAAWCITCQVNGRVAIHKERTMQAFKDKGVTLMIADWTRRNDDITQFLSSFGYKGVPLYVFYPANNGAPKVLPQLLTEDIVINAITKGE